MAVLSAAAPATRRAGSHDDLLAAALSPPDGRPDSDRAGNIDGRPAVSPPLISVLLAGPAKGQWAPLEDNGPR